MPTDAGRQLSERDKALAAELGRNIGTGVEDRPNEMPGAPTHTPDARASGGGGPRRERGLAEGPEKGPKGSLAARMEEHREEQASRPEPARAQEQARER